MIGPPASRSGQQNNFDLDHRSRALASALAVLIGNDGRDNDAAFDDFLVVRVDVEERET